MKKTKPAAELRDGISHIAWSLKQEGFAENEIASTMLETAVNLAVKNSNHDEAAKWLRTIADVVESRGAPSN
ncbi:MAG: hypothetical protein ACH254_18640 [Candidatus Thiodiazotropha endolucinida]